MTGDVGVGKSAHPHLPRTADGPGDQSSDIGLTLSISAPQSGNLGRFFFMVCESAFNNATNHVYGFFCFCFCF